MKLVLSAVASSHGLVSFYTGLGDFNHCQLDGTISQLEFSSFGQPHDQSACFVALSNHLIVMRGEDLRQSRLISFPHHIEKFAIFERQNLLVVFCQNSIISVVTADFQQKKILEPVKLRNIALDGDSETIVLFYENDKVKILDEL